MISEKASTKKHHKRQYGKIMEIQSLRQYELHQVRGYNLSPCPGTPLSLLGQRYVKKGNDVTLHYHFITKRKQKSFPDTIEKRFPYMWHINTTHES